jgi:intergrase/recombinase
MNLEFYTQLKHINVQYYYIRELVENDTVKLKYI